MAGTLTPPRIVILLSILLVVEAVVVWFSGGSADVLSAAQLVSLPLVAFLIGRLSLFRQRIPVPLLILACGLAFAGAAIRRGIQHAGKEVFLMARFDGDQLGGETMVMRDRIRTLDGVRNPALIGALERRVTSQHEAQELLASKPHLAGVMYGSERWLVVMLRQSQPQGILSVGSSTAAAQVLREFGLRDLQIVTTLPSVSVSFVANQGSAEYLGRLASVWGDGPDALVTADEDHRIETQLTRMDAIRTFWTTPEPLVFGRWMLGTYYLSQSLRAPTVSSGDVKCSTFTLSTAYSRLRPGEVPALEAAIINNLVVAEIVGYDGSITRRQLLGESLRHLHKAYGLAAATNSVPLVMSAIESNSASIDNALREGLDH